MTDIEIFRATGTMPDFADSNFHAPAVWGDPYRPPASQPFDLPQQGGHDPFVPDWHESTQTPAGVQRTIQDIAMEHPHEAQRALAAVAGDFASTAINLGVPHQSAVFGARWLQQNALKPPSSEAKWHDFQVDLGPLSELDRPYLTGFLNAAFKAKISQSDVSALLGIYPAFLRKLGKQAGDNQARAAATRQVNAALDQRSDEEIQQQDKRDKQNCEITARTAWGSLYRQNVDLINSHIAGLPKREQAFLWEAEMADGSLALNDFGVLQKLLAEASDSGLSRAELEEMLRTNRSKYLSNPKFAAHYRRHIEGAASDPQSRGATPIDAEIAQIEQFMTENRRAYVKNEQMQARYRELLRQRGR